MNVPSIVPFCSCSTCSVGSTPTGVPPSAATKSRMVGEAKRRRRPFMSSVVRIGFLGGVHVAGLVRQQQQHLHALVLGIEIFRAQLGIVEHLGADLGAADEIGQLRRSRSAGSARASRHAGTRTTSAWPVRAKS